MNKHFGGIVVAFLLFFGCQLKTDNNKPVTPTTTPVYVYNEGFIHGTIYHIVYEHPEGKDLKTAIEEEMQHFDQSLSTFLPTSVISRINQNDPNVKTDHFFETVFQKSQEIAEITDGAFDITVAPLVNAWGFGFKHKEKITLVLIDSLLKTVGWQKVTLENGRLIKENAHTMLDASAIAKGYSVDIVGQFLEKQGCKNYMVEIGGEVVSRGKNEKGEWWRIGINKPKDDAPFNAKLHAIVQLENRGLATSGNYRNFYIEGGKRYAHTINPKTGYPVQHSLLSATVLANDCMTADGYATAFMVMGLDKAIAIVKNDPELEAFFIYSGKNGTYKTWQSSGFKGQLLD